MKRRSASSPRLIERPWKEIIAAEAPEAASSGEVIDLMEALRYEQ
jgi:hypothetical protein